MNLGLGNLADLKDYVMHASVQADTSFDDLLQTLGKGVAAAIDRHCARKFERNTAAVDEFTADRSYYVLERYPIESITTVQQRDDIAAGYVTLTTNDVIINRGDDRGLIEFGSPLGSHLSRVKVTYAGGYWFDTTENYSGTLPVGATLLPADLKLAWQMQVDFLFRKRDALNLQRAASDNPEAGAALQAAAAQPLLAEVERILSKHIRYA